MLFQTRLCNGFAEILTSVEHRNYEGLEKGTLSEEVKLSMADLCVVTSLFILGIFLHSKDLPYLQNKLP